MFHLETEVGHIKVNISDHCSKSCGQLLTGSFFLSFLLYIHSGSVQTPGMVKHSFSFCTQLKVLLYVKPSHFLTTSTQWSCFHPLQSRGSCYIPPLYDQSARRLEFPKV